MANEAPTITYEVEGVEEAIAVLETMSPRMEREAKKATQKAIKEAHSRIIRNARTHSRQSALAARSVRVTSSGIEAAGSKVVRSGRNGGATGADLFYGSEFGGQGRNTTMQFPPGHGSARNWFYKGISDALPKIYKTYVDAVDTATREFAG